MRHCVAMNRPNREEFQESRGISLEDDEEKEEEQEIYLDFGEDGEPEFVVSLDEPEEDFFKEFVPPGLPKLYNEEAAGNQSDTPSKLFNEINEGKQTEGTQTEETAFGTHSEEDIQFLIKSVKYSRLMSAIQCENKLRDVVKSMTKLTVNDEHVVIQQGDTHNVSKYFVLESGAVDVFVFDQFRVTIQPGWCFGELSFVFGAPRSASCIASADSVLWVLNREPFDSILSGLSPLETLKIVRQDSDPGDEFDSEDELLSEMAMQQLYGADFFEDRNSVREITANFLTQVASQDYVGLPDEVRKVMEHFNETGTGMKYDIITRDILSGGD